MQPGSCGPANDAVAALSASAAPSPRAPRYLMTRIFMVVLHSSACVKAEEREGVVRLSRSPIPRFGRIPNPPGNCPPPASHDAGWQKRERWPMRSSPKQAPIHFGRHVHLLLPGWPRNRWRTPRGVSAGTSLLRAHSFQSSDGLTICAASCSQLRRTRRPALPRRTMTKARGEKIHARSV